MSVGYIAFFPSLFFLSISSSEQADLVNVLCYYVMQGTFFWNFYICIDYAFNLLQYFLSIWFSSLSPCLNWRQGNNFENNKKNMISIYLLVLIRIPNDLIRQHEQNMSDLNEHVFPSWQINEREDIVKLTCVFKNWTRYELHIMSKLLLMTNMLYANTRRE